MKCEGIKMGPNFSFLKLLIPIINPITEMKRERIGKVLMNQLIKVKNCKMGIITHR
jgi:hypothetical protein